MPAIFVRRECWTLTWTGRAVAATCAFGLTLILALGIVPFLASSHPIGGEFLVVEGWVPPYALLEAATQFRKGAYKKIIVAETLLEDWEAAGEPRPGTGEKILVNSGIPQERVVTAVAEAAPVDRTYHSALAVKDWLRACGVRRTSIDLVTVGPHARRSKMLFERALGDHVAVGVIAVDDRHYDPSHWWRSSAGASSVIREFVAYFHARLLFSAPDGDGVDGKADRGCRDRPVAATRE